MNEIIWDIVGALDEVAAGTSGTTFYAPVEYDPWRRTVTLVNDVSQHGLPGPEQFRRCVELATWLAEINEALNPEVAGGATSGVQRGA